MHADDHRPGRLDRRDVRRRFDRAAAGFERCDFVHRYAADGMFERMSPMLIEVRRVLDAGAACGNASRVLAGRFRGSRVISLDLSSHMLQQAKRRRSRFSRISEVQADAHRLPFATGSIDLVFANMLLPWIDDAGAFLGGIARVLRKGGLFLFSALGPDSLRELREAWQAIDGGEHVNAFADMHDLGDALVHAGLKEPVLDVEYLTVTYDDTGSLFADLTATGGRNCLSGRRKSLTARRQFDELRHHLERATTGDKHRFPLELVFGHAWGGGPRPAAGEFALDPTAIGRRRR